jgi:hypothetical protein
MDSFLLGDSRSGCAGGGQGQGQGSRISHFDTLVFALAQLILNPPPASDSTSSTSSTDATKVDAFSAVDSMRRVVEMGACDGCLSPSQQAALLAAGRVLGGSGGGGSGGGVGGDPLLAAVLGGAGAGAGSSDQFSSGGSNAAGAGASFRQETARAILSEALGSSDLNISRFRLAL